MIETSRAGRAAAPDRPECPGAATCQYTVSRVRWYLTCWRLAEIVHEPFDAVLRSESRLSRDVDPWARGGRVEESWAIDIGISLQLARAQHGLALNPWNAERIAAVLCTGDHGRPTP